MLLTKGMIKMKHFISSFDFSSMGGNWLGSVRNWIQCKCRNGETVLWGSDTHLAHEFTVRDIEEIAAIAACAAYKEHDSLERQLAEKEYGKKFLHFRKIKMFDGGWLLHDAKSQLDPNQKLQMIVVGDNRSPLHVWLRENGGKVGETVIVKS
jgi:hypothetical protein